MSLGPILPQKRVRRLPPVPDERWQAAWPEMAVVPLARFVVELLLLLLLLYCCKHAGISECMMNELTMASECWRAMLNWVQCKRRQMAATGGGRRGRARRGDGDNKAAAIRPRSGASGGAMRAGVNGGNAAAAGGAWRVQADGGDGVGRRRRRWALATARCRRRVVAGGVNAMSTAMGWRWRWRNGLTMASTTMASGVQQAR